MIKFINGGIEGFEKLGRAARNQKILSDIDEYIVDPAGRYWQLDPANYGKENPYAKIKNPDYQRAISEIMEATQREQQRELFKQVNIAREKNEYKAIASGYDPYNLSQKAKDNDAGGGFMDGLMSMFGAGGGAGVAAKLGFGAPALPAGMTKEQMAGGPPPSIFGDNSPDPRKKGSVVEGTGARAYGESPDLRDATYLGLQPAGYQMYQAGVGRVQAEGEAFRASKALEAQDLARIRIGEQNALLTARGQRIIDNSLGGRSGGMGRGDWYGGDAIITTNIDARGANPVKIAGAVTSSAGVAAKIVTKSQPIGSAYAGATP